MVLEVLNERSGFWTPKTDHVIVKIIVRSIDNENNLVASLFMTR